MKERPILFSAALVRALLAGTKTVTRRPVKLPPWLAKIGGDLDTAHPDLLWGATPGLKVPCADDTTQRLRNPWDWPEPSRLWVRETWHPCARLALDVEVEYRADGESKTCRWHGDGDVDDMIRRSAWVPSIHMPRWASRITLAVTSVGVERLQDITEDDVFAEGVPVPVTTDGCPRGKAAVLHTLSGRFPSIKYARPGASTNEIVRAHFASAWDSIYGAESWAANPWVWVVRFRRER